MSPAQMKQRIEALERELAALKALQVEHAAQQEVHHHYHYSPQPLMQHPYSPWRIGEIWCNGPSASADVAPFLNA